MSYRRRKRVARLNVAASAMAAVLLLSGCSSDGPGSLLIDPGHYSVYHCDGLAVRLKALEQRERDLSNLMARASEGGGGALIGNLTYRTDYENTLADEAVLRRTAAEKRCDLPPPVQAAQPAPTPAAYAAPPAVAAPPVVAAPPPPPTAPMAPMGAPVYQSDQGIR